MHRKIDCPKMCSHHSQRLPQTSVLLWPSGWITSNIHHQVLMPVMTEKVKMCSFDVLTQRVEMIASLIPSSPFHSATFLSLTTLIMTDWSGPLSYSWVKSLHCPCWLFHYRLLQSSVSSRTKGERCWWIMNAQRAERVLIKKDTIKNASIRIGWVLIICYIIKQAVYCCVI